jgi:hypothetical protein
MTCNALGFANGECYVFGASSLLAPLPTVAGFRTCDGSEDNLLRCPFHGQVDALCP